MKKVLKISSIIFLSALFILAIFVALVLNTVIKSTKDIQFDKTKLIEANSVVCFYDINDNIINDNNFKNKVVNLQSLPDFVKNAFISIEDKKFYSHNGLNYKRMIKSMINNIKAGYLKEGASTISQQLIKNTHLSNEKTLNRKIKEIILTKKLEKNFSKDDILETYLNVIYFGNNCYGLEDASLTYFNKSAKDLNLQESALLAGMIKAPNKYSPINNAEKAKERRNLVLSEMKKDKVISENEYEKAVNSEIELNINKSVHEKNVYELAVIDEAKKILKLNEQDLKLLGIKIYTYLDQEIQNNLISSIKNEAFYHKNSYGNTADSCAICIDNKTGGINGFFGKCDYDLINLKRQPGSTIKPILVYAPSLEKGIINPETPILDEKINIDGYSPNNVGFIYHGYVSATESVEQSLNIPAVKLMKEAGIEYCKQFAENAGISFKDEGSNLALSLGGFKNGTNLISLTNTYLPFSDKGNFVEAKFIREIKTLNDKTIYKNNETKNQIMSEETAYLMNKMLISGVQHGTSSRLKDIGFTLAGKTGTVGIKNTNLNTDVYSVAYTKDKTCGVWLGNPTSKKEYVLEGKNNGGTFATSMLKEIFSNIYKNSTPTKFDDAPEGITKINIDTICLNKGEIMLATENTPPKYIKTIEVNKKFNNFKPSSNYTNPNPIKLSVKVENNMPNIKFNAENFLTYKIYRIEEDETKLIETIQNKSGEVIFKDELAKTDTFYNYYIETSAFNYANNSETKPVKSNVVKVIILE